MDEENFIITDTYTDDEADKNINNKPAVEDNSQTEAVEAEDNLSDILSTLDAMNQGSYLEDLKYPTVKEEVYDENNKPKQKVQDIAQATKAVLERERIENSRTEDRLRSLRLNRMRKTDIDEEFEIGNDPTSRTMWMMRKEIQAIKKRQIIFEEVVKIANQTAEKVDLFAQQISEVIEKSNENEFAMQLSQEDINTIAGIAAKKVIAQMGQKTVSNKEKKKTSSITIWQIIGISLIILFVGGLAFYKISNNENNNMFTATEQEDISVSVKEGAKMKCDGIEQQIDIRSQKLKGKIKDETFEFYGLIENKTRKCKINMRFINK